MSYLRQTINHQVGRKENGEKVLFLRIKGKNKLGWTEPHSRFPLGFDMNLPYEVWVLVMGIRKSLIQNLSKILLSKAKLNHQLNSIEFEGRLHSYPLIHPRISVPWYHGTTVAWPWHFRQPGLKFVTNHNTHTHTGM